MPLRRRIVSITGWCALALPCPLHAAAAPASLPVAASPAQPPPFTGARTLDDAALDRICGGFLLPNGMDIAIGIQIDTLVNGALALRTVLSVNDPSRIGVFTGGTAPGTIPASSSAMPIVHILQPTSAAASTGPVPDQQQILLTPNGPGVATQWGTVQLQQDDHGAKVLLSGSALELQHMIGTITGAMVANMANDRSIDTTVTVNLNLRNSAIPAGNMFMQVEPAILGAAARGLY